MRPIIEPFDKLHHRKHFVVAEPSPRKRIDQRLGQGAVVAGPWTTLTAPWRFDKTLAVGAVTIIVGRAERRQRGAERIENVNLARRIVRMIVAADHARIAMSRSDHDAEVVGRHAIAAQDHEIVELRIRNDLVKGTISVPNAELDDLVILRGDGVPTYNFGVVVDDLDMAITHVIRGDDHVNNTPRQIHIFNALGATLPAFGHVPMILGADGERLSKRHGAVSVVQYRDDGTLPEALVNALARLGWSHGDDEVFSMVQLVEWFDLAHVSRSAAQFDPDKLNWLNHEYIKCADDRRLAALVEPLLRRLGAPLERGPGLEPVVALLKDRATSLVHLAEAATLFYLDPQPTPELLEAQLTEASRPALRTLKARLGELAGWDKASIGTAIKAALASSGLKMPQLAMPLRVLVTGRTQTPSVDAVLELLGRETVLARLSHHLDTD